MADGATSLYATVNDFDLYYEVHGSGQLLPILTEFFDAPMPVGE